MLSRNVAVVSAGEGLPRKTVRRLARSARRVTGRDLELPGLVAAAPVPGQFFASQQAATTALTYLFFRPAEDRGSQLASARAYADALEADLGGPIERSQTGDKADIIEALFATEERQSVLGTYSIDDNGDTTLTDYGVNSIDGGELQFDQTITAVVNVAWL